MVRPAPLLAGTDKSSRASWTLKEAGWALLPGTGRTAEDAMVVGQNPVLLVPSSVKVAYYQSRCCCGRVSAYG